MNVQEQIIRTKEFLARLSRSYRITFGKTPEENPVLADLAVFCRATESCYHDDPRKHAVAEGRREVWLRIQRMLNLNSEQLYQLYAVNAQNRTVGGSNG